jgi:hypothetical protein
MKISGDYSHKYQKELPIVTNNMVNKLSDGINNFLVNNFDFTYLPKVAIFYKDDLQYRMDLLSQLIIHNNNSNEEFWLNLLQQMKNSEELLKNYNTEKKNFRLFKKPKQINPKTSWVDMMLYIPTHGFNYRTDVPKDIYSEPYFGKSGDCEDLALSTLHFDKLFRKQKFKDTTLNEFQKNCYNYISFFTFCLTKNKQAATGKVDKTPFGHICALFIKKNIFYKHLKDTVLKNLMLTNDPYVKKLLSNNDTSNPILIGEGTAIVNSFIQSQNYDNFNEKNANILRSLISIRDEIEFKGASDTFGIRNISDPNTDFYDQFAMLFTSYFYSLDKKQPNINYGFICATKFPNKRKPCYGINFNDLISINKNIEFHSQPPMSNKYSIISKKNARYQVPIPICKKNGDSFENIFKEGKFYNYQYNDTFFCELRKYEIGDLGKIIGYCYLSDEEIYTTKIRKQLMRFIKRNKLRICYQRQGLLDETSTHLFVFYQSPKNKRKVKKQIKTFSKHDLLNVPVENMFLFE